MTTKTPTPNPAPARKELEFSWLKFADGLIAASQPLGLIISASWFMGDEAVAGAVTAGVVALASYVRFEIKKRTQ